MALTRDEVVDSFVEETAQRLVDMEDLLDRLGDPARFGEAIHSLFRHAHSIKGSANLLGFRDVELLAHRMENVLDFMRNGLLTPSPRIHQALLQGLDAIGAFLDAPQDGPPEGLREVMKTLSRVAVTG